MRLCSWTVPVNQLGDALAHFVRWLDGEGWVMLYGPEAARLLSWPDVDAAFALGRAGHRWPWGRAFSEHTEIAWRAEGQRGVVVVATESDLPPRELALGDGVLTGEENGAAPGWARAGGREPAQLLLWAPGDRRIRRPDYPPALANGRDWAISIVEYESPDGVEWRRYTGVKEA